MLVRSIGGFCVLPTYGADRAVRRLQSAERSICTKIPAEPQTSHCETTTRLQYKHMTRIGTAAVDVLCPRMLGRYGYLAGLRRELSYPPIYIGELLPAENSVVTPSMSGTINQITLGPDS